jgi:hypothetical protein
VAEGTSLDSLLSRVQSLKHQDPCVHTPTQCPDHCGCFGFYAIISACHDSYSACCCPTHLPYHSAINYVPFLPLQSFSIEVLHCCYRHVNTVTYYSVITHAPQQKFGWLSASKIPSSVQTDC